MARRRPGLIHVSDCEPGYRRQRRGKGFVYLDTRGRRITDARVIARIKSLAIPPAYTDVWICPLARGHMQATARDARGRKQYRYHPLWKAWRDDGKFGRMADFARALPKLRARITRDLCRKGLVRERVLATIVRLLDRTHARIGNEEYAKANHSFGLSTLRDRHARVRGDQVILSFRGKSGQRQQVELDDARVAAVVRRCGDLPGQHLFRYRDEDGKLRRIGSQDVNDYLRDIVGEEFTAKDFRTWAATVSVARALFDTGRGTPAMLRGAIARAASQLGNTSVVCRRAYVHPSIVEAFEDRATGVRLLAAWQSASGSRRGLDQAERAVLAYLLTCAKTKGHV